MELQKTQDAKRIPRKKTTARGVTEPRLRSDGRAAVKNQCGISTKIDI